MLHMIRGLSACLRIELHKPQDDVGIALAWPAHGRETIDNGGLKPNWATVLPVKLRLVADASEQKHGGDRVEGGQA